MGHLLVVRCLLSVTGSREQCCREHGVQVPAGGPVLRSFRLIPGSGVAGSWSSSVYGVLRNLLLVPAVFDPSVISPAVHRGFSVSTCRPTLVLFCLFGVVAILTVRGGTSFVILICISLMIGHVEHLFSTCWLFVIVSLEKCLFKSFAHIFLIRLFEIIVVEL